MTFRSPHCLFLASAILVAAGIAAACGPYPTGTPTPAGAPAPGISLPPMSSYPVVPPHTPMPYPPTAACPAPIPPTTPGWTLTAEPVGKIQIRTPDGLCATSLGLTLTLNDGRPMSVSGIDKKIRILFGFSQAKEEGDGVEAEADRVVRNSLDGAVFTLEGNAKLAATRGGKRSEVQADRITVNVLTGKIESEFYPSPVCPGAPLPAPVKPYPETPVKVSPSLIP